MIFIPAETLVLDTPPRIVVTGEKTINMDSLWKAFRKLSSENSMVVVRALYGGGKTFGELQADTGLIVNDLNHILYDMKQMGLVTPQGERKGERTYHLTSYCVILLDTIVDLKKELQRVDGKDMFSAWI